MRIKLTFTNGIVKFFDNASFDFSEKTPEGICDFTKGFLIIFSDGKQLKFPCDTLSSFELSLN
ncbi:MAG: hypothetical protein ACTTG9_02550 [Dialister pneumosintes]